MHQSYTHKSMLCSRVVLCMQLVEQITWSISWSGASHGVDHLCYPLEQRAQLCRVERRAYSSNSVEHKSTCSTGGQTQQYREQEQTCGVHHLSQLCCVSPWITQCAISRDYDATGGVHCGVGQLPRQQLTRIVCSIALDLTTSIPQQLT